MMNRRSCLVGIGSALALSSTSVLAQNKKPKLVVVGKVGGIPWFNAMEEGIKKASKKYPIEASMINPTSADAAQQVRIIEDLITRKVDVIGVIPNDAVALDPVLAKAKQSRIKILVHESPEQKVMDWDFELTTTETFAIQHMDLLAQHMKEEGKYIVYVGSLTTPLHNSWADAAIKYQKEKYPKMQMVGDKFGVAESINDTLKTTLDQIRAIPDLKGILAFGSQGPTGAARALDDRNKSKSIALIGSFSPGQGAKYIKLGTIRGGFMWNPMLAGELFVQIAFMLANGKEPFDGMELDKVGKVKVYPDKRLIQAQKLEPINLENIDRLVKMGL